MGFLRSMTKFFRQELLIVRMTLAWSAVALSLYKGERILKHEEMLSDKVQTRLPPALVNLVQNQPTLNNQIYLITLPHAQYLLAHCKHYASDKIQLDCSAVENLQQTTWPADFHIHWHYEPAPQRLERQFSGADHHLGYGWFHRQQQIWTVSHNPADPLSDWLNRPQITGPDIFQFVATVLPTGQHAHLPLSCDLSIETDFQPKLTIVNMRKKSLTMELTANRPTILAKLQYLEGDAQHMISETKLLPDLRAKLGPQLYALAHQPGPKVLEGDTLLNFLQHEVKPHATFLGVDLAALEAAYPIVDAVTLTLVWKLKREARGGIGRYRAIPWLEAGPIAIQFSWIDDEILCGARFVRVNDGWLELTEAYKQQHRNWLNQQVGPFQLRTGEVLGASSERLRATGLKAPQIEHQKKVDEVQITQDFLVSMSYHGLPVALAGLPKDQPNLLASLCKKLRQQSTEIKILWIADDCWHPSIQSAMSEIGLPTGSDFPLLTEKLLPGGVYLISPFVPLPSNVVWDLLIIHQLDALLLNKEQTKLYSEAPRLWSIATFEKPQHAEQDRQLSHAMQILQNTATPLDIFRRHCLLVGGDQAEKRFTRRL